MSAWITVVLPLSLYLAAPADESPPAPTAKDSKDQKKDSGKSSSRDASSSAQPAVPPRVAPKFKLPAAAEKFEGGVKKMEAREYNDAKTVFNSLLKDASTPADKKLLQGWIDDAKFGVELEGARDMAERKDERRAITRVEKALKTYGEGPMRAVAERFIQETEEVIYLLLDDFEPGGTLDKETQGKDDNAKIDQTKKDTTTANASRWKKNHSFNADPKFVRHGKGSMKWKVGGDYYYTGYRYYYDSYSYHSLELKSPITKWRYLAFSVFLPEADDGALRITLAPDLDMGVMASLFTKKFVDFRGKRGWLEVKLDLRQDFGGTANLKLEDVRYVRIDYAHMKYRTIYLDYVHFE